MIRVEELVDTLSGPKSTQACAESCGSRARLMKAPHFSPADVSSRGCDVVIRRLAAVALVDADARGFDTLAFQ